MKNARMTSLSCVNRKPFILPSLILFFLPVLCNIEVSFALESTRAREPSIPVQKSRKNVDTKPFTLINKKHLQRKCKVRTASLIRCRQVPAMERGDEQLGRVRTADAGRWSVGARASSSASQNAPATQTLAAMAAFFWEQRTVVDPGCSASCAVQRLLS